MSDRPSNGHLPPHPEPDIPCCGALCSDFSVICTRGMGHPGSHMATADGSGTVAVWDDELTWDIYTGWR